MATESTRCGEVGGDLNADVCTYDKEHKGPHSWDTEELAKQQAHDVAQAEKDKDDAPTEKPKQ